MKRIVFTEKNFPALRQELDKANGKARERTIDTTDIAYILKGVDKHLGISKAAKKGVRITYRHGAPLPKSYKYIAHSTQFKAEFNGKNWVITDIYRGVCNRVYKDTAIELPPSAQKAILASKSVY